MPGQQAKEAAPASGQEGMPPGMPNGSAVLGNAPARKLSVNGMPLLPLPLRLPHLRRTQEPPERSRSPQPKPEQSRMLKVLPRRATHREFQARRVKPP